jgi:threonine synthase
MAPFQFRCTECGATYGEHEVQLVCPSCSQTQQPGGVTRGVLDVEMKDIPRQWPASPSSSREFLTAFLPLGSPDSLAPLAVGDTPLLEAPVLRRHLGVSRLWLKDDTRNPSGSTKDRASLLVVAKAREYGLDTVATASTGNAATALAAVAAAAGARAVVSVPHTAPEAKLAQMLCYGAGVIPVEGTYDQAFDLCVDACREFGWYNRNTALNPFTIEGKKTAALEIARQLAPEVPDAVLVPTGDGVIIAGAAKGFADLQRAGLIDRVPRLIAVQPEGSAGIARALQSGVEMPALVSGAHSVADSLTVEIPRNGLHALKVVRASGGAGVIVTDEAIVAAIALLARLTGVFAEPAAASALAGLVVALDEGVVERSERVVLLITGNGLKDVPAAMQSVTRPSPVAPTLEAVAAFTSGSRRRPLPGGRAHS